MIHTHARRGAVSSKVAPRPQTLSACLLYTRTQMGTSARQDERKARWGRDGGGVRGSMEDDGAEGCSSPGRQRRPASSSPTLMISCLCV